jgi:hypothetical protein
MDQTIFEGVNFAALLIVVLLIEETGVLRENHRHAISYRQTLSHNVVLSTPRLSGVQTHNVNGDWH